MHQIRF